MSDTGAGGRGATAGEAPQEPPEEPYLAAAAADRWDVLRYEEADGAVHRVVPAGAGSSVVTTYERRGRSRRRLVLALVPLAAVGLPAAGWLFADAYGLAVGAVVAAITAAIIVRRHVSEDPEDRTDVPEVVDASASAETARSYGLENDDTIADAEAYLAANPDATPDRSPEDALDAAQRRNR
ncbi:hypothetical protein [Halobaculum lipolyticum]|uniref:Uncharacterized protein n=1 Tax=Halobaculum lipolyticum TaxID=3032001 RepID=A0ABD5W507_9EURY|nr:hypothetical protein [Halobaculum sp. DT31]